MYHKGLSDSEVRSFYINNVGGRTRVPVYALRASPPDIQPPALSFTKYKQNKVQSQKH